MPVEAREREQNAPGFLALDFAALSKQYSKDAAAVEQGGDLGYFKAGDMVPEFSTAAFALKDKEVTPTPVHTQFGWHVIQALDRRTELVHKIVAVDLDLIGIIDETKTEALADAKRTAVTTLPEFADSANSPSVKSKDV